MAVKIIVKNSSVEDRRPTAGQLENGEIALNYNEAGAFITCKDTNGDIQQVGGVKINETAPDSPPIQCLWFQPTSLTLFVFDGDSWLPVAGGGGGGGGGGGDITQIIGNQGIDANEIAGIVTLDADLDADGLRFLNSRIALNIGDGLKFENRKLVADASTLDISIDDLTDVDTSTNAPNSGEILVWDGTNWVPESLADGTITQIIGNQGIDATEVDGSVTLDADLDDDGLRFLNSKIALNIGDGLKFESRKLVADIDWSTFPGGDNISWDPVDEEWNVGLKDPVTIGDSAPDPVEENYFWWDSSKGELFVGYGDPSGDSYWVSASRPGQDGAPGKDGDPVIISQDVTPDVVEDAIWFNTATGEAFFGYVDPSGDEYWVSLSKPGAPGKDGDPVVISQDTRPPFQEDAIWFNTSSGEAYFGYIDPSGDEYWIALSKPGAPGAPGVDGIPVVISQDTRPPFQEDAIWFDTSNGEAYFGYRDPSGDEYWIALSKPGAPGKDGDPVVISQDITPPFQEDAIWFNTSNGEAYFGYKDPSGDEYWIALSKPGAPGKDGSPVIISQDTTPNVVEDAIWFNTSNGEAYFGYKDPSGDEYWVALSKPGAPGKDGSPVIISQDVTPDVVEDAIWFNTSNGEAFFGYVDPSGDEYWVALSKPGAPGADGADGVTVVVSDAAPANPVNGQIWHNSRNGVAYAYWSSQGVWVSM